MDCSGRGTKGKMSEAVEIAQPVGSGTLTAAGKSKEEKKCHRENGAHVAGQSKGPSVELRMALEKT